MTRHPGFLDDLMAMGSKLPWKVALPAAIGLFITLHVAAIETQAPATATLAGLGAALPHGFIHVFAEFFQYVIPACLLIGTTAGYLRQRQTAAPFVAAHANPKPTIDSMSWRDFEKVVGEAFRQQGFKVTGFGGNSTDGGVDLGLTKNGERFLVQCKHWKKRQVGVTVVRELHGVMSAQGAHGGFVLTGGEFSREAREFARLRRVELIDGSALQELLSN